MRDPARPVFAPDGRFVALNAPEVRVFRVADGGELALPRGRELAFSPDSREVAITSEAAIARCDLAAARCERLPYSFAATRPTFGPDGALAATQRDVEVRLWRPGLAEPEVAALHRATVSVVAFSTDGRSLVTAGAGPEVQVTDLASGEFRRIHVHDHPVAVHHDGQRVRVADWFRTYEVADDLPRDEAALRQRLQVFLERESW